MKRFLTIMLILSSLLSLVSCKGNTNEGKDTANTTDNSTTAAVTEPPIVITELEKSNPKATDYYQNPFDVAAPDPYVLFENEIFYIYGTNGFNVHTSRNLRTFNSQSIYTIQGDMTKRQNFWAPEVFKHEGKYYLIFSCQDKTTKRHSIYLTVADSPKGPFKDTLGGDPLYAPDYSVIDAHLYRDDDGKVYMFYSRDCSENIVGNLKLSESYVIEMKADLSGTVGNAVLVSSPTEAYETKSGTTRWNEGPVCIKRNGIYYVIYSCNYYSSVNYSLAYSTATNIMGPYTKADNNPILASSNSIKGPGHNNLFLSPDGTELYTVYHCLNNGKDAKDGRSPCIDRVVFDEEGRLFIDGPSDFRMPVPSGTNNNYILEKENISLLGSDIEDAEKVFDTLTNGLTAMSLLKDKTKLNDGYIELGISGGYDISNIWIYPPAFGSTKSSTFDLLINGKYSISGLTFEGTDNNSPLVVSLSKLPEGETVETVRITGHVAADETRFEISEIRFQYKKAN